MYCGYMDVQIAPSRATSSEECRLVRVGSALGWDVAHHAAAPEQRGRLYRQGTTPPLPSTPLHSPSFRPTPPTPTRKSPPSIIHLLFVSLLGLFLFTTFPHIYPPPTPGTSFFLFNYLLFKFHLKKRWVGKWKRVLFQVFSLSWLFPLKMKPSLWWKI